MLELCYTQHATTKVLARVHTSTACMHMSDNLLPLKQHICPALSPAESSRASLLPLSFEMLCAAACSITASISCPAAANNQARAKAPPTRGSFRPPEPQLPSLPEVVKESRPLIATKCCGRQLAHGHQPRHLQTSTDCLLAFLTVQCDGLGPQAASGPSPTTKLSFSAEGPSRWGAMQSTG